MKPIRINKSKDLLPLWVKPTLCLLVVLACLAIGFIGNAPKALTTNISDAVHTVIDFDLEQTIEPLTNSVSNPLADIQPQLLVLTEQHSLFKDQQTNQHSQIQQHKTQIQELKESLATVSARLTQQHNQLQQLQAQRISKVVHRSAKTSKPALPNISLASIDQWGDSHTVVLKENDQLITLRQGQQHRGWQLTRIDSDQQQVELLNPLKQQLLLNQH